MGLSSSFLPFHFFHNNFTLQRLSEDTLKCTQIITYSTKKKRASWYFTCLKLKTLGWLCGHISETWLWEGQIVTLDLIIFEYHYQPSVSICSVFTLGPALFLALKGKQTKSCPRGANISWTDEEGRAPELRRLADRACSSLPVASEGPSLSIHCLKQSSLWFGIKPWTVNQKSWVFGTPLTLSLWWGKSLVLWHPFAHLQR